MALRSAFSIRHPARTASVAVGFAAFFGAIAGARALLLPAAPMTWIVDDDGGSGVHFTDIQPALDAAVDGDLVLVHPGNYSSFTLTESLSIQGLPGGNGVNAKVGIVTGVASEAAVADITFTDFYATDCTGTLVLDAIFFPGADLTDCADVRMIAAGGAVVVVDDSTVELVSCNLSGVNGAPAGNSSCDEDGLPGGPALVLQGDSRAYVARPTLRGGNGGKAFGLCGYPSGGDGGDGIEMLSGDLLLLGGGSDLIQGGAGGDLIGIYGYGGDGGNGVSVGSNASLRHSNVVFKGGPGGNGPSGPNNGSGSPGKPKVKSPGGSIVKPSLPDPALERTAVVQAGGMASVKLLTQPGAFSRLFVGNIPIVKPTPNVFVDSLVVKEVSYALGFAPSNGVVNASFPLDPSWTQGTVIYAQGMSIFPGGEIRRTNSVPFVVH